MNIFTKAYLNLLKEDKNNIQNLIIVDVQPSYRSYISFNINKMLRYSREFQNVLWLYNR
jgi:hypothetical protein